VTERARTRSGRAIAYGAIAAALAVLAIALSLLDPDPGMTAIDYAMAGVVFAGSGTLAIVAAVESQLRAAVGSRARLIAGSVARSVRGYGSGS
jgi:hypothetical protein